MVRLLVESGIVLAIICRYAGEGWRYRDIMNKMTLKEVLT
jgi:hypothetical protein